MTDKELRELDAWIAEHVFGWVWKDYTTSRPRLMRGLCRQETDVRFGIPSFEQISGPTNMEECEIIPAIPRIGYSELPHYATDPASAMQVLEKCHEQCCVETGKYENISGTKKGYFARSVYKDMTAESNTLPLAICLLAKQLFIK